MASRPSPRMTRKAGSDHHVAPATIEVLQGQQHQQQQQQQLPLHPYEPLPSQPRRSNSALTYTLIATCTAIFGYKTMAERAQPQHEPRSLFGSFTSRRTKSQLEKYRENFVCSRRNISEGRWWVLLTSTLAHGNLTHLGMNMLALHGLGPAITTTAGKLGFVAVWVATGLGSHTLTVFWPEIRKYFAVSRHDAVNIQKFFKLDPRGESVGASGALFGMWGYLALTHPAMYGPMYLLVTMFEVACLQFDLLPSLGHTAHLSGGLVGAIAGTGARLLTRRP